MKDTIAITILAVTWVLSGLTLVIADGQVDRIENPLLQLGAAILAVLLWPIYMFFFTKS